MVDPLGSVPLGELDAEGLEALWLTTGSPVFGTPSALQFNVLDAADFTVASPVLGVATGLFLATPCHPQSLITGSPVLGSSLLHQANAIFANGFSVQSPYLASPFLRTLHDLTPLSMASGSPILGVTAPIARELFRSVGLTVGPPEFSLEVQPRVWFRDQALAPHPIPSMAGKPLQIAIFTNYNDATTIDIDPKSIVGNSRNERAAAERIQLAPPFQLINKQLVLDKTGKLGGSGVSVDDLIALIVDLQAQINGTGSSLQAQITALQNSLQAQITAEVSNRAAAINSEANTRASQDVAYYNSAVSVTNTLRSDVAYRWNNLVSAHAYWQNNYGLTYAGVSVDIATGVGAIAAPQAGGGYYGPWPLPTL